MSPPGAFRRGGRSGNGHDVSLLCDPAWLANRYLRSVQLHKLDDTGIKQVVLATGCSLGTWHVPSLLLDVWAGRWGWLGVLLWHVLVLKYVPLDPGHLRNQSFDLRRIG